MMLLLVLCSFSLSFGKYFFKINQQFLVCWLSNKLLNSPDIYAATASAYGRNYQINFSKKLINAMLQGSRYVIASCFREIALSFVHEQIITWRKNTQNFWDNSDRGCSRFKTRSFDQILTEIPNFAFY